LPTIYLYRLGSDKARFAANPIQTGCALNASLATGAEAVHNLAFALPHPLHVNADRAHLDSVIRGAARQVCHPRASNHGLGWRTAFVDASAADVHALDQRGALTSSRE